MKLENDHLTPEDFLEFIDQGGSSGPAGHHLMACRECLSSSTSFCSRRCRLRLRRKPPSRLTTEWQPHDFHNEPGGGIFPRKGGRLAALPP